MVAHDAGKSSSTWKRGHSRSADESIEIGPEIFGIAVAGQSRGGRSRSRVRMFQLPQAQ
jgi:hypothetical protein